MHRAVVNHNILQNALSEPFKMSILGGCVPKMGPPHVIIGASQMPSGWGLGTEEG